jgi:hypothetical protein
MQPSGVPRRCLLDKVAQLFLVVGMGSATGSVGHHVIQQLERDVSVLPLKERVDHTHTHT